MGKFEAKEKGMGKSEVDERWNREIRSRED